MKRHQMTPPGVYAALAARLGLEPGAARQEGPVRNPMAGPADETPVEQLLRLSTRIEQLASEIGSMESATYRAQLWQQWSALFHKGQQYQAGLERIGSARRDTLPPGRS